MDFVFYKRGASSIKDLAVERDGAWFGAYGGCPEEQLIADGFERIAFDDALAACAAAQRAEHCTGPTLIDQEDFDDMFEVLPPARVGQSNGWFLFSMSEMTTGNLTAWYGQKDDRYVTVTEDAALSFSAIAEIMERA